MFWKLLQIIFLIFVVFSTGCAHVPVATTLGLSVPSELPPEPTSKRIDVALVLGGGGARGLAHAGVLEVLEEEGIPIDLIVGTSSGAAVGAIYASYIDAQKVKQMLLNAGKWDFLDISIFGICRMAIEASGPISGYNFEKFFIDNLPEKLIEQLSIPFAAVAVDIETTEPFIIKSGPMAPAVHASAAIPPLFCPVKLYGRTLVDGGVSLPVPVDVAREYNPKLIIAVDISPPPAKGCLKSSFDLAYRALEISYSMLSRMQASTADIEIHPDLEGFGFFEDARNEELYFKGMEAARNAIPEIKRKLDFYGISLHKPRIKKAPFFPKFPDSKPIIPQEALQDSFFKIVE
jgi:NTE family protein